jgi:nucleoside-diphosphate-sugar epimerase
MTWLLIGCGYTGRALASALVARGTRVMISRRTPAAAAATGAALAVPSIAIDLASPSTVIGTGTAAVSVIVCLAPPGRDPAAEIAALLSLATVCSARRLIYISSTGVYGPAAGALVDESTPLSPITASGLARTIAETALARAASPIPTMVLRVAGIYGPTRSPLDRLRAGTYRIIGDGHSHVSRIHVDDLVTTIIAAGESSLTGVVNVADDDPAEIGTVADTLAHSLALPPPPRVDPASVDPEIAGMLTADRRIDNTRLKTALGVRLAHPSWRSMLP